MGDFIEAQGGKYVTAEDSGTCVDDMKVMAQRTTHVSGVDDNHSHGGDPSPYTAYGIYAGMLAAIKHKLGKDDVSGIRIAVQGAGAVGRYLSELLIKGGATVFAADVNQANLDQVVTMGAKQVAVDEIIALDVDVFAPCAMGAILNDETIPTLKASIIAGGANNQIAEHRHGEMLRERGILYAPDFVINAGGIIEIHHQREDTADQSKAHIEKIGDTLLEIFAESDKQKVATVDVAEQLAEAKFQSTALQYAAAYASSNNA